MRPGPVIALLAGEFLIFVLVVWARVQQSLVQRQFVLAVDDLEGNLWISK